MIKEHLIREMVVGSLIRERDKVVKEMIEAWDKEGEGSFRDFILLNFSTYWLLRAWKN